MSTKGVFLPFGGMPVIFRKSSVHDDRRKDRTQGPAVRGATHGFAVDFDLISGWL